MAQQTAAGSSISIGSTTVHTTAGEYSGDPFVEIGEVTNIGEFGKQYQMIETKTLKQRMVQKVKGSYDNGTLELDLYLDPDDAGQTAAIAARDADDEYNFMITLNDAPAGASPTPTTYYFRGIVTSFRTSVSDVDSAVTAKLSVGINTDILTVAAAPGV